MADFMDFFLIGDGESSVPASMEIIRQAKKNPLLTSLPAATQRKIILWKLATQIAGIYVPQFYAPGGERYPVKPLSVGSIFAGEELDALRSVEAELSEAKLPDRVLRQTDLYTTEKS
jgi:radical SAM superfamily enzyme YgiQ (UPF0313 family)